MCFGSYPQCPYRKSLSARRAWIEILTDDVSTGGKIVALRKESVDRNLADNVHFVTVCVALRKESVDRNGHRSRIFLHRATVALRKESVDRNLKSP